MFFVSIPLGAIKAGSGLNVSTGLRVSIPLGAIKACPHRVHQLHYYQVSIPLGAIKALHYRGLYRLLLVSIPLGAIKVSSKARAFTWLSEFQFLLVQLRPFSIAVVEDIDGSFNSSWCN